MNKKRKAVRIAASIVAAIAIWLYVDTVRMPSVPMTVKDIPVEFAGESTIMADKGLMLLSGYDTTIDLTLKGPRRQLYKMNKDEINSKIVELKKELFNLRMKQAVGNLDKPHKINALRKDVARLKTILAEKDGSEE